MTLIETLIERAKGILEGFKSALGSLKEKLGMDFIETEVGSSQIVVSYPPYQCLHPMMPKEIFSKPGKKATLYFHLPFCTGKCLYCSYYTLANRPHQEVEDYIRTIIHELELVCKKADLQEVTSVYIGGGTPTYLNIEKLELFLSLLNKSVNLSKVEEVTLEASPETILKKAGKHKLVLAKEYGVTRLNIGVQSWTDDLLLFYRRRHVNPQPTRDAYEAIDNAFEAGFKNVNIDLIYRLPEQTLESWEHSLMCSAELEIPSITTYLLRLKPGSILWNLWQKKKVKIPDLETRLLMKIMAVEFLSSKGYKENPIDWFTRSPKYQYKQQLEKWQQMINSIGLGVSSYGYINGVQYYNHGTMTNYMEAVHSGHLPIDRGLKLSSVEQLRRNVILGLKTGINFQMLEKRFGLKVTQVCGKELDLLQNAGLIQITDNCLELSYLGKLLADEIAYFFFSRKFKA